MGDRISVNPVQSCNACDMCRAGKPRSARTLTVIGVTTNGGFAEYAKTKIAHAYKLPESLTDEQGAFVEMLSSAVNAVKSAEIEPGDLAVVYGPGPVGLSMVQLLKNEGARVALVGTRDYRLESASRSAPTTSGTRRRRVAVLDGRPGRRDPGGERRPTRRPGDGGDGGRGGETSAIEITGKGSTVV